MNKLYLISSDVAQHKAELHTHTTCSDGVYTPLESRELYKSRGYRVVAYTDHDVFVRHHTELTEKNFIALNAFELGIPSYSEDETDREKQVHLNFIAENPDIEKMPFYNPKYIYQGGARQFVGKIPFDGELEDRRNTVEWLNYAIKKGNEQGFLVIYNHPIWSLSEPQEYLPLNGLLGMEVWNTSGLYTSPENGAAWREMIIHGKDIKCIAANDFHTNKDFDCMLAATYICTNDFSYKGIIDALKAGNFYSSTGPEIKELSVHNGKLHIKCSPVKVIRVFGIKSSVSSAVAEFGEFITEAEFPVKPYMNNMFYVHMEGKHNTQAWTNPIFNLGKLILDAQMIEKKESLFLFDKMVQYPWIDEISDQFAYTYFYERKVAEQIKEISVLGEKYDFKKIYLQFSSSEIIGFDYIFDKGVEEIQSIQSRRLQEIKKELALLSVWAKRKDVKLIFLSMLPVQHSANVYDYRNNYARAINKLLKEEAETNGWSYVDVSTPLENSSGILAERYEKNPTCLTEEYFLTLKRRQNNE